MSRFDGIDPILLRERDVRKMSNMSYRTKMSEYGNDIVRTSERIEKLASRDGSDLEMRHVLQHSLDQAWIAAMASYIADLGQIDDLFMELGFDLDEIGERKDAYYGEVHDQPADEG